MNRQTSPMFLRVSLGLGLATAAVTSTLRADPGLLAGLHDGGASRSATALPGGIARPDPRANFAFARQARAAAAAGQEVTSSVGSPLVVSPRRPPAHPFVHPPSSPAGTTSSPAVTLPPDLSDSMTTPDDQLTRVQEVSYRDDGHHADGYRDQATPIYAATSAALAAPPASSTSGPAKPSLGQASRVRSSSDRHASIQHASIQHASVQPAVVPPRKPLSWWATGPSTSGFRHPDDRPASSAQPDPHASPIRHSATPLAFTRPGSTQQGSTQPGGAHRDGWRVAGHGSTFDAAPGAQRAPRHRQG